MAKSPPTWNDADLILRLDQLADAEDLRNAFRWAREQRNRPELDPKEISASSSEYDKYLRIASFFETMGTLAKYGLINEDLLYDRWLVYPYWDLFKSLVKDSRKRANPLIAENFEWLAKRNKRWVDTRTMPRKKNANKTTRKLKKPVRRGRRK